MKIAIHGAAGRMGQRVTALASQDSRFQVVAALESANHPLIGKDAGLIAGVGEIGVPLGVVGESVADVVAEGVAPGELRGGLEAHDDVAARDGPLRAVDHPALEGGHDLTAGDRDGADQGRNQNQPGRGFADAQIDRVDRAADGQQSAREDPDQDGRGGCARGLRHDRTEAGPPPRLHQYGRECRLLSGTDARRDHQPGCRRIPMGSYRDWRPDGPAGRDCPFGDSGRSGSDDRIAPFVRVRSTRRA